MMYKEHYSPGPSYVRENVRLARAYEVTNPDIDTDFVKYYKETADIYNKIIDSDNNTYILSGEAILGLEAACATLTEENDRVLIIDNGIYGNGFKDFVSMYSGIPVLFEGDYKKPISTKDLEEFLKKDSDFKYATVVHCDTPTGVINDIHEICPILKKYGILSVVDSVSGMVGEYVSVNKSGADIILGGSQKAISAQPGLTIVTISEDAQKSFAERKTPIRSFYANLRIWENYLEEQYFPYTMPTSDIVSLRVALENIMDEGIENVVKRHERISIALRNAIVKSGLKLYLESGYSNTVTAIEMPENISALALTKYIYQEYGILIATSLVDYKDKLVRIGHMGDNADYSKIIYVLDLLEKGLKNFGFEFKSSLVSEFINSY